MSTYSHILYGHSPAVVGGVELYHRWYGPESLNVFAVWLLRGELASFGSGRSVGAICPFIDIHPKVDREIQYLFFKILEALAGWNAI